MNIQKHKLLLVMTCVFFAGVIEATQPKTEQVVLAFVNAFNQQDVEAMLNLVDDTGAGRSGNQRRIQRPMRLRNVSTGRWPGGIGLVFFCA